MNALGLIRVLGCFALCFVLLSSLNSAEVGVSNAMADGHGDAAAEDATEEAKPKRRGPPPLRHTEFLLVCASCHKPDGRGGRSYGGYAANLHLTELEYDGLVYVIKHGIPENGMPPFDGVISDRTIDAVATYILENFKGKPVAEEFREHSRRN